MEISEERLADIVEKAARRAFEAHVCRYRPAPETVDHVFGMIEDIGDGDQRKGIEVVRRIHTWAIKRINKDEEFSENHKFVSFVRATLNGVGGKLATGFVWMCVIVMCAGLLLFFGSKAAPLISALVPKS